MKGIQRRLQTQLFIIINTLLISFVDGDKGSPWNTVKFFHPGNWQLPHNYFHSCPLSTVYFIWQSLAKFFSTTMDLKSAVFYLYHVMQAVIHNSCTQFLCTHTKKVCGFCTKRSIFTGITTVITFEWVVQITTNRCRDICKSSDSSHAYTVVSLIWHLIIQHAWYFNI